MNLYSATWDDYFYDRSPFESVKLVISFNTTFKLIDTYYTYRYDDGIELDIWTYADNKEDALTNIIRSNALLTYLYGISIRCDNNFLREKRDKIEPSFTPLLKKGNLTKINLVSTMVKNMPINNQTVLFDVLGCYSAGIRFMYDGFYPEALITLFRIFESINLHIFEICKKNELHYQIDKLLFKNEISLIIENHFHIQFRDNDYQNLTSELANKIVSKIKNESYSIISYLLKRNNISYNPNEIDNIVQMRNDITHMKSTKYTPTQFEDTFYSVQGIITQLVSQYFFKEKYSNMHLKSNVVY